jgi:16S rRNA C1402 (ribose-2'-O) methylase RsmI
VVPLPGPSAAIAAWSAPGSPGAFQFVGFLPRRRTRCRRWIVPWPVILYEAPHRVLDDGAGAARAVSGRSASW